jgi:hypothetical protein
MAVHLLGDALAAAQPGGEELEAVGLVGRRTRGAHRRPPVAAGLEEGGIRLAVGRIDGADLARLRVGMLDPAAQPHRMGAVAGGRDLLGPPRIAVPGPVHDFGQDAGEQLAHANRVGHAAPSGAGMSGTTRSPGAWLASNAAGSALSPAVARTMAATWW